MKFLNKKLLTVNSLSFWISFCKFKIYILKSYNMTFYKYKTIFKMFFNYFYFIKYKPLKQSLFWKINTYYINKYNYTLKNSTFYYILQIKRILFNALTYCFANFFLRGRGFRFLPFIGSKSFLTLKLGYSHFIYLQININLKFKFFFKNFQKFGFQGSIFQIIQIYSCLYFIYKKNIYTNKGIFFINEKLKNNKFIKKAW